MGRVKIDPRSLSIVEEGPIQEIDADGIIEEMVRVVGDYVITTFFKVTIPFGHTMPARVPILRMRRPIDSYQSNRMARLIAADQKRAEHPLLAVH